MNEIERKVMKRGYRYCRHWSAGVDDVWLGNNDSYAPQCQQGDVLVEMIGYDLGSVAWTENWGGDIDG